MNIPERLKNLLAENSALKSSVELVCDSFLSVFGGSTNLFLFPEYTDHGSNHLTNVLALADGLIRDECRDILTPEDAGTLTLAVLLHDAAMHLTADSFLHLISDTTPPLIPEFDGRSWSEEFDAFFSDAQRWDDRKLYRIIGDQNNEDSNQDLVNTIHIHPKDTDPESWTTRYRKFLGEFVRLHHARFAHEIALRGFPQVSSTSTILNLNTIPEDLRDIAGLVARSHNLPLRSTFSYLQEKYDGYVICRKAHPVFLMVLLRIADYLQLDSSRVNKNLLQIQKIRSPLSQEEWNAHLGIQEVRRDDHDIESIYVSANPDSAITYLRTQSLLAGLQKEMDTSWAVLGEVYSQRPPLSKFGVTIRRIRSNINDVADYVRKQKPSYYPIRASFETTGSSLTKLLVKPLYGDNPSFGVRELMQNSLDAVRELSQYIKDNPQSSTIPRLTQSADVLISIERKKDGDWFCISDRGIGMTPGIVSDYYLKAGASFRYSDFWWKHFGSGGKSKILRSGRFGIGALAAFLLGDRIELITRHFSCGQKDGVAFEASIKDEIIQLRRVELPEVGTIIKIKLSKTASDYLRKNKENWDWYILEEPSLERRIDNKALSSSIRILPWQRIVAEGDWRVVQHKSFEAIQWTYSDYGYKNEDRYGTAHLNKLFVCNGILIGEPESKSYSFRGIESLELATNDLLGIPSILVYDPDGNLALNLKRTDLESNKPPFYDALMEDVARDFIAFLLVHGPRNFSEISNFESLNPLPISLYRLWGGRIDHDYNPLFAMNDAFGILTPSLCKEINPKRLLTYIMRRQEKFIKISYVPGSMQCFKLTGSGGRYVPIDEFLWSNKKDGLSGGPILSAVSSAMLIVDPKATRRLAELVEEVDREKVKRFSLANGGVILHKDEFDKTLLKETQKKILKESDPNIAAVIEASINWSKTKSEMTIFDKVWKKLCPSLTIPFDIEQRRRVFASTFKDLKNYVQVWENPTLIGWRAQLVYGVSKGREFRRMHNKIRE